MVWSSKHIVRLMGFPRREKVILQVKDSHDGEWRDAHGGDLEDIENDERAARHRRHHNGFFPVGVRVWINSLSNFNRGARGEVVFQEPHEGRVWVLRDGSSSPVFFYGYELDYDGNTFTRPELRTLDVKPRVSACLWWIAIGEKRVKGDAAIAWCNANGVEKYLFIPRYEHGDQKMIQLAGFDNEHDAMMFWLAHTGV